MHRTARQADIPGHLKVPTPDTMELVGGDRSSSAPRNIAEGLGRFLPGDFAKFVRTARGSLVETQDHLDAALERGATCVMTSTLRCCGSPIGLWARARTSSCIWTK